MTFKAIIIGSSRGISYLDFNKSYPTSLQKINSDKRTLDWVLSELKNNGVTDITYIGGYHIEKVVQNYPTLKYFFDPQWEKDNALASLATAVNSLEGNCLIFSSEIIFRGEALKNLMASTLDITVGFEESRQQFIDIVKTTPKGTTDLKNILSSYQQEKISKSFLRNIAEILTRKGIPVGKADLTGHWAPLDDNTALARFIFGTKAQTLDRLQGKLTSATIQDQVSFKVSEWKTNQKLVIDRIQKKFPNQTLVVRSSSLNEDSWTSSHAGHFKSILNINGNEEIEITQATQTVIQSYETAGTSQADHYILVQPQVGDVIYNGVLLTRDLESGASYYVINASRSCQTDAVTSGAKSPVETIYLYKYSQETHQDPLVARLIAMAKEIEECVAHDSLDLEFAINKNKEIFLLQARPLILKNNLRIADSDFAEELDQVSYFLDKLLSSSSSRLYGKKTILGIMPDWNPAEMIGTCPHPLSLSLYQRLITDHAWSIARAFSGYNDVWPEPLVISLAGRPYVDFRVSLNSFLPKNLDPILAGKLIEAQLSYLEEQPALHDKIEFEVATTCLDFDFNRYEPIFKKAGLTPQEKALFRNALLQLTDNILLGNIAPIGEQLELLKVLEKNRIGVLEYSHDLNPLSIPRSIWNLTQSCIHHGVVPFSILARYAFISLAFLKSLVKKGIFTPQEAETFLTGIPTIASEITDALSKWMEGKMQNQEFVAKYGHLRPGSYNILSPCYAQALDQYFPKTTKLQSTQNYKTPSDRMKESHRLFDLKQKEVETLLKKEGFQCSADQLKNFILKSIPAREFAKFEFMKNVNNILELVAEYGNKMGFSREDMSYISIEHILRLATDSPSCAINMEISRASGFAKKRYKLTRAIRMPYLIHSVKCLDQFQLPSSRPNFITTQAITTEIVHLNGLTPPTSLKEKLVLIEGADPGYDWIFSHGIAGLITVYGGVASHMAIRAAEFGLPSAIGCGELIFEEIREARVVELDCSAQIIRRVL